MPSVSEQIQAYRAFKAQEETIAEHQSNDVAVLERQHPSTKDFFKLLMQRWQTNYMKNDRS
jgi:hypothetical protein